MGRVNWAWVRRGLLAGGRGLAIAILGLSVNIALFTFSVVALFLWPAFPVVTRVVRARANLHRRLARDWAGVEIPSPYRSLTGGFWRRYWTLVTDPATWRDLLWLILEAPVGGVLGLVAFCFIVYGLEGALGVPVLLWALGVWFGYGMTWPIDNLYDASVVLAQGLLILLAGLALGPWLLGWHARFAASLLAPTRAAALAQRVSQLSASRTETIDTQAAELRRIERDLHDGAQARLVALSMHIGLAEELVRTDPAMAEQLLAEAREASGHALGELRDLVRGIHPPVLAERGLDGAVRALALTLPVPVEVEVELPGRLAAPVESAAYFAVAEALANMVKHSRAEHGSARLTWANGALTMVVRDDGVGGASFDGGTGLRGIQRRLAAFDGTMSVASPLGGPTVVTMELPCASSSPKTSPSSGTG
ncbi:sensor domain-containing protein [Actinomycetes bacterium KLBMP 9797]